MKALLMSSARGIVVFNESNEALDIIYEDLKPEGLANAYLKIESGQIQDDLRDFVMKYAHRGFNEFEFEELPFQSIFQDKKHFTGNQTEDYERIKGIRTYFIEHLESLGVLVSEKSYESASKVLAEYMASKKVAERSTEHDLHVKEALETVNELDRSINSFTSRLREWYGLHFPELTDKLIENNEAFAHFVANFGKRENISIPLIVEKTEADEKSAVKFMEKANRSMGGELTDLDVQLIQQLANRIINLIQYRKETEDYISTLLDEVAPNLKAVLGSQITAKLIAEAGSLEKLSKMTSSTIQLLGAEKALFKALNSGSDTPKYGLLFQWHKIRGAKPHLRGKIARMVAGKLSILARVDYFEGDFIGEEYSKMIDEKIEYIQKTTPEPTESGQSIKQEHSKSQGNRKRGPRRPKR